MANVSDSINEMLKFPFGTKVKVTLSDKDNIVGEVSGISVGVDGVLIYSVSTGKGLYSATEDVMEAFVPLPAGRRIELTEEQWERLVTDVTARFEDKLRRRTGLDVSEKAIERGRKIVGMESLAKYLNVSVSQAHNLKRVCIIPSHSYGTNDPLVFYTGEVDTAMRELEKKQFHPAVGKLPLPKCLGSYAKSETRKKIDGCVALGLYLGVSGGTIRTLMAMKVIPFYQGKRQKGSPAWFYTDKVDAEIEKRRK